MTIRVFLLDDHEIVRRGVRELLESDRGLRVVGESGTVGATWRLLPRLCPEVAVLDVQLPDGSGIEVCRELRSTCPQSRALILTSADDELALSAAVLAGASGYLLKDLKSIRLGEAVRAVAAGESLLPPARVQRIRRAWHDPFPQDRALARLTSAEQRVLDCIAHGLTNAQICAQLTLPEAAVRSCVKAILSKLGFRRSAPRTLGGHSSDRDPRART